SGVARIESLASVAAKLNAAGQGWIEFQWIDAQQVRGNPVATSNGEFGARLHVVVRSDAKHVLGVGIEIEATDHRVNGASDNRVLAAVPGNAATGQRGRPVAKASILG